LGWLIFCIVPKIRHARQDCVEDEAEHPRRKNCLKSLGGMQGACYDAFQEETRERSFSMNS
jgi:hypothetical protein